MFFVLNFMYFEYNRVLGIRLVSKNNLIQMSILVGKIDPKNAILICMMRTI